MKKKLLALALSFAMIFTLTACGGGNNGGEGEAKTNLTIIDSEWYGMDTFQLDSTSGAQDLGASALFAWDSENGCIADKVCTDWTVSEDGLTVTFNVPEGMKYSTGEQVEPEDVVASIEHGLKVSPYSDGYTNIESMDIDGRQVTLHLSEFHSELEYYMTSGFIICIDKDELDTMSDEELCWGAHPYGPYALEEYISGSEVKLVRNDGYVTADPGVENKGAWNFETINVRFNVEDFTATEELKEGTVDMIMSLSRDQYLELAEDDRVVCEDTSYPCINYFEINTDLPCFQDIRCRKALALAINRDGMAEVADGQVLPAYALVIEKVQNYNADAEAYFKENYANNVDEAKKLLEEAGWVDNDGDGIVEKDGEKFSFVYYTWASQVELFEVLQQQLKEIGMDMQIETLDWNYIHEKVESDDYGCGVSGLSWAEPMLLFDIFYYDQNAPGNDKEYRALVNKAKNEADSEARTQLVGEIQKRMFDNVNIIPMYEDISYTGHVAGLKGLKFWSDGTMDMNDMTF